MKLLNPFVLLGTLCPASAEDKLSFTKSPKHPRFGCTATCSAILIIGTSVSLADYPLQPVPIESVKIEDGFWGQRLDTNTSVTLPNNLAFIEKTGRMAAFDRAAGMATDSSDSDVSVVDSDVHKILEGAAYTLQMRPHDVNAAEITKQVARVIAAQQKDGFLCPRVTLKDPKSAWENLRGSHVLYSAGHLFETGVAWRNATGKSDLLEASTRFADLIDHRFGPGKVHDVPGHQEIELALVRLYQATGERRYLDLCRFFLDQRGHIHGGNERVAGVKPRSADYNQDRVPLAKAAHAVGHAVRGGYTYAAMTDIAALLDDKGYRAALDRLWKDVVGSKLYITGSSATAQFHDEGYGEPYHLPNETAYCETCSTISNVLWSHRMALMHADASYIDVLERALYNGVLSGISLSGDHYFYKNPLASRGGVKRQPSWNPACCQSNIVRIIPQVGSMAYATGPGAVYVNLFVAGEATLKIGDSTARLRLETDYPWDGKVRITVLNAPEQPFTIALRVPGWAREEPVPSELYHFASPIAGKATVTVAGMAAAPAETEDGYARFERTWKTGEVIEMNLPMPARRVLANDRVEANRGRISLQRGPLVYCVEATDHGDLRTDSIVLPDHAPLEIARRDGTPDGAVLITAEAMVAVEPQWGGEIKLRPQALVAVPYYTWANRGDGYMDIWLARTVDSSTPLPAATGIGKADLAASGKITGAIEAIRDGRTGPLSESRETPRASWADTSDGKAWIECRWSEPRELDRTAVYWAVDRRSQVYWGPRIRGTDLALPKSWRILYQDGDAWFPVETEDPYTLRLDLPNDVSFSPVKTHALRLELEFADSPCAIQEWWVD